MSKVQRAQPTANAGLSPRITAPPPRSRPRVETTTYIVFAAALLRAAGLALLPHRNIWVSAAELGNIAKSLAQGQGFSSPFGPLTGPTAWIPPVYPLLLAGIFRLFGIFSRASAMVAFLLQIAISSLTCIPLLRLGEELGNRRMGLWAAWGWACFPYFVLVPVLFIWETTLSAFLLSCLLLITTRLRHRPGRRCWAWYGGVWGIAALTNTALLALLPVCLGWLWWQKGQLGESRWISNVAVAGLVGLLLIAPWCWRNWKVFHTFVPVRSNFGEELWLGNHEGGRGRLHYGENAYENSFELQQYKQLGEIAYVRGKQRTAITFIATNPGAFCRNAGYRLLYFWFAVGEHAPIFWLYAALGGLALAGTALVFCRRAGEWYLIAFSVLVFPLTYYLTDVMARYRHPVEPAMTLAAAYLLGWAGERRTTSSATLG